METKYEEKSQTNFSPDSTFVSSVIIINKDTLYINSQNKETCIISLHNKVFKEMDFSDLEYEQYKIANDFYHREILLFKYEND